tara:strand:+ start:1010 stop:1765 length:756 start_codon:yes stop_codon:yes gene_type:complete
MFNNWKPKSFYTINLSGNHTNRFQSKTDNNYNNKILKAYAFKARPLKHYRRQYTDNKTSKTDRLLSQLNAPGGFALRKKDADKCYGIQLEPDYMLSKNDYSQNSSMKKCNIHSQGAIFSSNKELLHNRQKMYKQNLPIKKTNIEDGYSFSNDKTLCVNNDVVEQVDVIRYSKPKNTQYLVNGGVSSSTKTTMKKFRTIQTAAKSNNLSLNSIAMSLAYNKPTISMKYELFEKCGEKMTKKRNNYCNKYHFN